MSPENFCCMTSCGLSSHYPEWRLAHAGQAKGLNTRTPGAMSPVSRVASVSP